MFRGGTPEIRDLFIEIDPNPSGLKRPDWFRQIGRRLGLTQSRIRDLYYDETCKLKDWETQLLNKTLRTQKDLEQKLNYQKHITGNANEHHSTHTLSGMSGNRGIVS